MELFLRFLEALSSMLIIAGYILIASSLIFLPFIFGETPAVLFIPMILVSLMWAYATQDEEDW